MESGDHLFQGGGGAVDGLLDEGPAGHLGGFLGPVAGEQCHQPISQAGLERTEQRGERGRSSRRLAEVVVGPEKIVADERRELRLQHLLDLLPLRVGLAGP